MLGRKRKSDPARALLDNEDAIAGFDRLSVVGLEVLTPTAFAGYVGSRDLKPLTVIVGTGAFYIATPVHDSGSGSRKQPVRLISA